MNKKLIGIAGYPGCGKTTVATLLRGDGWDVFDNREVLIAEYGEEILKLTVEEKIQLYGNAESIFLALNSFIARRLTLGVQHGVLFIDSFKVPKDRQVLSSKFPNADVSVISLICPQEVRDQRLQRRAKPDDITSVQERDAELDMLGLYDVIQGAEFSVDTNCSRSELRIRVRREIAKLRSRGN